MKVKKLPDGIKAYAVLREAKQILRILEAKERELLGVKRDIDLGLKGIVETRKLLQHAVDEFSAIKEALKEKKGKPRE